MATLTRPFTGYAAVLTCTFLTLPLAAKPTPERAQAKELSLRFSVSAPRVIQARAARLPRIIQRFTQLSVSYPAERVYLRAFKQEAELEVWVGNRRGRMQHFRTYPICAASGELGPKRRRGDLQVPEGLYTVNRFNPWSNFHLSFGINYPNKADRILGYRKNLGGDIFLHGDCVTIGCIPIEDDIEELYIVAVDSANLRPAHPVRVDIFPARLDAEGMQKLRADFSTTTDEHLLELWRQLQPAYMYFEEHHQPPRIRIESDGRYREQYIHR